MTIAAAPNMVIPLGRLGENEHTRIKFDIGAWQSEYPGCHFTLLNKRPGDTSAYPVSDVEIDGSMLIWTVQSNALTKVGRGECELCIMLDEVVAKSVIYTTSIRTALDGSGEVPSEWETWQQTFAGMVSDAEQAATDADAAKQAVEDLGVDAETLAAGSDATVTKTVDQSGVVTLTFGIPQGEKGDPGNPGEPGQDGVSPTASVVQTETGATVTVTDASGTTTATLTNGQDGTDGQDGVSPTISASGITGGHRLTITDHTGTSTIDVMDGQDGKDGKDGNDGYTPIKGVDYFDGQTGADGYSPSASVSKSGTTTTITVTDKTGTTTATVSDGQDGAAGQDGHTPVITASKSGTVTTISVDGEDIATVNDGSDGATGTTFTPSVAANGDISWTNDGGKTNPQTVNIKGPQGESSAMVVETVSGSTPTITAQNNTRYVCGTVSTLSFTPCATGICDVIFQSGSTATVLTAPNTVKWPEWFNPASLDANTTYELNIMDGVYGAVGMWT